MVSRLGFLKELLPNVAGAFVHLLDGMGRAPEPAEPGGEAAFLFTELSPALLAMEAERLGEAAACFSPESLRRQLYLQMKQQAPAPGPDTATDK